MQAQRLVASGAPVPAVSPGHAATTFRLGSGAEPGFANDLTRQKGAGDFLLYRQLHLEPDAPHAGALAAQQQQVAARLHNLAIGNDDLGEKVPVLSPDQRQNLKPMLALKAKGRDGAFILSAMAVGPPLQDELQNLVKEMGPGVHALAYTGAGAAEQNLCFGDQIALRVAVIHCLDQIQEIR